MELVELPTRAAAHDSTAGQSKSPVNAGTLKKERRKKVTEIEPHWSLVPALKFEYYLHLDYLEITQLKWWSSMEL